jgi:hypothetical protein
MKLSKLFAGTVNLLAAGAIAGLAMLPFSAPFAPAQAAATTQTLHAVLCRPESAGTASGPGQVTNPNTTTSYSLNTAGCALIAAADIGYFLSQGYYYGPSTFVLTQTGITANTTASTSTITLPAYAMITAMILEETAGNAITGGVDVGDAGSATRYASAVALTANNTVVVADSALTRVLANSGVPVADQVLVVCHTACNSGSINISIQYTYY